MGFLNLQASQGAELKSGTAMTIKSGTAMTQKAGTSLDVAATANLNIKGMMTNIKSDAVTKIAGALVKVN